MNRVSRPLLWLHLYIVPDILESVTIQNLDDADTSDIDVLELWLDNNGDELWQNSDSLLGQFSYGVGFWGLSSINLSITAVKPTLFIMGDVSLSAQPNVSFRGSIPVAGCQYESPQIYCNYIIILIN